MKVQSWGEVPPESQGVMCACKDDISCLTYRSAGAGESLGPVPLVCDGHGFPEKAARDSSGYSAAKVDGPSPVRSKSPGHSYLTEAKASAQPSGRKLLAVRRTRTDAGEKGATASISDTGDCAGHVSSARSTDRLPGVELHPGGRPSGGLDGPGTRAGLRRSREDNPRAAGWHRQVWDFPAYVPAGYYYSWQVIQANGASVPSGALTIVAYPV